MSEQLIKFGFVAGEISPTYFGRADLEKFDLALALARNWIVDYRGGLITRPGLKFVDPIQGGSLFAADPPKVKFFEFNYNLTLANSYLLVFTRNMVRFVQDGAYVLQANKVITAITKANPAVVTSVGHGYATGDFVKHSGIVGMTELNGRVFSIIILGADTYEIYDHNGNGVNSTAYSTYVSGGVANRVYTVVTPYDVDEIPKLRFLQINDTVRIMSAGLDTRDLKRVSHTNWTLGLSDFDINVTPPTGLTSTPSAAGTAGVAFGVTAVDRDGNESAISDYLIERATVNYAVTAGSLKLFWNKKNNISHYNIYRSLLASVGASITRANDLGYIGRALGPNFVDTNIIPDFATTPPKHYNPFASSRIVHVDVTAAGTGYTEATVISASGGGTGFSAFPILNSTSGIAAIVIVDEGKNYSGAVTISATIGTGATFDAIKSPATADGPQGTVACRFQQRQIFAGITAFPLRVIGSRPGRYNNFDYSIIGTGSDSFEYDIDSPELTPIRHLVDLRFGILVMTQKGIWLLNAGNDALTALNAQADLQTFIGAAEVVPLRLGSDVLYVEDKTSTVRLLTYNDISKALSGIDTSILSQHFFSEGSSIESMCYAASPHKLTLLQRNDGALLSLTVVKEQNVFAWTQLWTKGYFKEIAAVVEGSSDTIYVAVERVVGGIKSLFIETMVSRNKTALEDAFCVDSGLSLPIIYNSNTLTFAAASGADVIATASVAIFNDPLSIGDVIRANGGKAIIISVTSTTVVHVNILSPLTKSLPEDETNIILVADPSTWTVDRPVTTLSGLWHLEGQSVTVLGDGKVLGPFTVTLGSIALPVGVTRAIVGLPFKCVAQTMPISSADVVIDDKRKRVVGVNVRRYESKGLKIGRTLSKLYSTRQKTRETLGSAADTLTGEAVPLESVNEYLGIEPFWDPEGQFYLVQDTPQPSTALGLVVDLEVGDDKD